MRIHRGLLAIAALVALGASAAAGAVTAAGPAPARLRAFDGCPSFLAYVRKEALPLVGPWGLGGGVTGIGAVPPGAARDAVAGAPGADTDFSGTNVQEEGVDEPDLVKTDGTHAVRRLERARERVRRPLPPAQARGEPAPREGGGRTSSCSTRPPARALSGIPDADPDRRRHRHPRSLAVSRRSR